MTPEDDLAVLRRALDQLTALLDDVGHDGLGATTPCEEWSVQDLVDHVVAAPERFARMVRDQPIDWSAPTPSAGDDPAGSFRSNGAHLLRAWQEHEGPVGSAGLDWQCAEFAVHTWDLATALGRSTADLDPEVADRGLAFMRANLTDDNRGPAFGPQRPAPPDADPYQRIAAFAGRRL